jgi:hypothetical protein
MYNANQYTHYTTTGWAIAGDRYSATKRKDGEIEELD